MKLEIAGNRKIISEDNVDFVILDSVNGSIGILPGHTPLLAELKIAPMSYDKGGERRHVAVMGGVVRVIHDNVTIITEDAESAMEIDVLKARKEKEMAEAYMSKKVEITETVRAEIELRKAIARLKAVEISKRHP